MNDFLAELKRRHVYRVGAGYAVVAWALTQVVDILAQIFTVPLWIAQSAIVLMAVGFPIALLIAWTIERKPQASIASAMRANTAAVDWLLFAAVATVIGLIGYQQMTAPARREANLAAARTASLNPGTAIALAVLPLVNLSADPEQEFFSDGMTEEITSALAKIPDLRVVGRASAFRFKGQNEDLRAIGQALNATHLIEGSVRKEGGRIRITAELVKAEDGLNLWRESYDRELTGVFAIQEEIATAIAGALKMPLGLNAGERLVPNRIADPELYSQYLRARALLRARNMNEAAPILESLVARNPDFAPAWALLPRNLDLLNSYNLAVINTQPLDRQRRDYEALLAKEEAAAREAIRLDPKLPLGYTSLGRVEMLRGRWSAGDDFFKQALALDPNDPDVLDYYSQRIHARGQVKEALRMVERLRQLEPFVPVYALLHARYLQSDGQIGESIRLLENTQPGGAEVAYLRNMDLARAYAAVGRYGEAADSLLAIPEGQNRASRQSIDEAVRLLRSLKAPSATETLSACNDEMRFACVLVGAIDRIMDDMDRRLDAGLLGGVADLWGPDFVPLRKTERFKNYVRKNGFVEFWRARGWADRCHPTTGDDFECE